MASNKGLELATTWIIAACTVHRTNNHRNQSGARLPQRAARTEYWKWKNRVSIFNYFAKQRFAVPHITIKRITSREISFVFDYSKCYLRVLLRTKLASHIWHPFLLAQFVERIIALDSSNLKWGVWVAKALARFGVNSSFWSCEYRRKRGGIFQQLYAVILLVFLYRLSCPHLKPMLLSLWKRIKQHST